MTWVWRCVDAIIAISLFVTVGNILPWIGEQCSRATDRWIG